MSGRDHEGEFAQHPRRDSRGHALERIPSPAPLWQKGQSGNPSGKSGDPGRSRQEQRRTACDDLLSFLLAQEMDIAADYLRRGRSHRELNAAELAEARKAAFRAYSREPRLGPLRFAIHDFQAELDIRGIAVPFAEVQEDLDRLTVLAATVYEQLKTDKGPGWGDRL